MTNKIAFLLSASLLLTGLTAFAQDTTATKKMEEMILNSPITMNAHSVSDNINMTLQREYDDVVSTYEHANYRETVYKPCEIQLIGNFFDNGSYNLRKELPYLSFANIYQFMKNCENITIEGHTSKVATDDKAAVNNNKRLSFDRAMEIAKLIQEEWAKNDVIVSASPTDDGLGRYTEVNSNKKLSSWPMQRNTITNPANATQNIKIVGLGDKYAKFQRPELQPGKKHYSMEQEKEIRWYEAQDRKIIIKGTTK